MGLTAMRHGRRCKGLRKALLLRLPVGQALILLACLRICITDHKIDTLDVLIKHVVDGVASTTAHSNHFDDGGFFSRKIKLNHWKLVFEFLVG